MIIWITGLSGSGKTTLAKNLIYELSKKIKKKTIHIDGDNFRNIFNDLGHNLNDRKINAERVSKLVNLINKNLNVLIIVSLLSISQKWLNWNKKNNKGYFQIFLDVDINTLRKRNIRKIYSNKKDVVGVHIKYHKPLNNNIVIKNDFKKKTFNQISKMILKNKSINKYLKRL